MLGVLVWSMTGIALWHFTVLMPDRFAGGIIGAFLAALVGALASGVLLPTPGLSSANPPGAGEALYALPGSVLALAACYWRGHRAAAPTDREDEVQGGRRQAGTVARAGESRHRSARPGT